MPNPSDPDYRDDATTLPDALSAMLDLFLGLHLDDKPRARSLRRAARYLVASLPAEDLPDIVRQHADRIDP